MMMGWSSLVVGSIGIASFLALGGAETVDLRGLKRIEFSAELEKGATWGVQFQLMMSPEGEIYNGPSETYGSYSITAKSSGLHAFEFFNNDAVGTPPKKISFSIVGDGEADPNKKLDPVQNELRNLNAALRTVRDEHAFLMEREVKHRDVAMNTNRRVMWWFILELIMLAGVCYWQIRSLKGFFETRRLV